jgi:hypothetical protein
MSDEPTLSPAAFGRAFRALLEQAVIEEKAEDPPFVARVAPTLDYCYAGARTLVQNRLRPVFARGRSRGLSADGLA